MSTDREPIAGRLRRLRAAAGLTQEALAAKAGVSSKAVKQWEQGLRGPSAAQLEPLSHALGVSLIDLITGADFPASGGPRKNPSTSLDTPDQVR